MLQDDRNGGRSKKLGVGIGLNDLSKIGGTPEIAIPERNICIVIN